MSLLLKNELRLSVGGLHSAAALWRAGWTARCTANADTHGGDGPAIDRLLVSLTDAGHALPRHAAATVGDDLLRYAVLPASGPWRRARLAAQRYFADVLGDDTMLVAYRLLPGGRQWLAVGLDRALVLQWREALAGQGIGLRSVRAALLQDLWQVRGELPRRDGVVAVLRDQGVALAGFRSGALRSLGWERCDMASPQLWVARIQAFHARLALASMPSSMDDHGIVRLLVPNPAQRVAARGLATPLGWRLIGDSAPGLQGAA